MAVKRESIGVIENLGSTLEQKTGCGPETVNYG